MSMLVRNTLVVVPTSMERDQLVRNLEHHIDGSNVQLCGFGPVVAAARTAALISEKRPKNVLLAGIAGSYTNALDIGESYVFHEVGCYGIGVGMGDAFRTAGDMGWNQWQNADCLVRDQLPLHVPDCSSERGLLLTVTHAAGTAKDCEFRLRRYPAAKAEDMEAFGVAVACTLAGVPLTVIRGISNRAGDRDKKNWCIEQALQSASSLVAEILKNQP